MSASLPQVTKGQIVAATLRSIAGQMYKLAEMLDEEAAAHRPPVRQKKKKISIMEMLRKDGAI
ncbi:MAG: hypothetical protein PHO83_16715 [Geobacteraceae bacterium]|nr:hypothetical protein [Geobacteraceae bacterium]